MAMTDPAPDSPPSLSRVVAALSQLNDVASLTRVLAATLPDLLPAAMVRSEYRRTLADRLAGRPGTVSGIEIDAADKILALHPGQRDGAEATISHHVRGVILSRTVVSLTEWIAALADALHTRAVSDDAARVALEQFLLG